MTRRRRFHMSLRSLILSIAAAATLTAPALAGAHEVRPLTLEAVDQVVESHDREVQACGRRTGRDTLAVLMRIEIGPDGRVARVQPSATGAQAESRCLERVAKRLQFPATGVSSHVEYPFMLVPRR
jgi:hypothetical protein